MERCGRRSRRRHTGKGGEEGEERRENGKGEERERKEGEKKRRGGTMKMNACPIDKVHIQDVDYQRVTKGSSESRTRNSTIDRYQLLRDSIGTSCDRVNLQV
jgi:hypothetical protein